MIKYICIQKLDCISKYIWLDNSYYIILLIIKENIEWKSQILAIHASKKLYNEKYKGKTK